MKRFLALVSTVAAVGATLAVSAGEPAHASGSSVYYDGIKRASEYFWPEWTATGERFRVTDEYEDGWGGRGVLSTPGGTWQYDNNNGAGTSVYWLPNFPEGSTTGHQICRKNGSTTLGCASPVFQSS